VFGGTILVFWEREPEIFRGFSRPEHRFFVEQAVHSPCMTAIKL